MHFKIAASLLILFNFCYKTGYTQQIPFDKAAYYKVFADGLVEDINMESDLISKNSFKEKQAYQAALLMKKAGLVSKPMEKLKLFKSGRIKLEESIAADSLNTEYRFLRLLIQEHAPKIVKYRNKLLEDSKHIESNFKTLSPLLQQTIKEYSKKSTILKIL